MFRFAGVLLALSPWTVPSVAQAVDDRPWGRPAPIMMIDPYEKNGIDWDRLVTDRNVKSMIHRAGIGLRADTRYRERAAEARRRGIAFDPYQPGLPGDPIAHADRLIAAGAATGTRFLALDIENLDPKRSMSIPAGLRFLHRVHERTGRHAAL